MIPRSLYIHIPWCVKKCPYCDFNSHTTEQRLPEQAYLNALLTDLEHDLKQFGPQSISTIFIGGGTPSLMSADFYAKLVNALSKRVALATDAEITLEANPGTIEADKFKDFFAAGINRLSIGVQSFNDQHLQRLGRIHDSGCAQRAIDQALSAGFKKINIDLMFGLPEQTKANAIRDLDIALSYPINHLSWYQLTIEPNTVFYREQPLLPNIDRIHDVHQQGQAKLASSGFKQYEISAYAKPDGACKHNINYWQFGDYLGIGAGAHGKITEINNEKKPRITRTQKTRLPKDYLKKAIQAPAELGKASVLPKSEYLFECLLNGFRLKDGIALEQVLARAGTTNDVLKKTLSSPINKQLVTLNQERINTTPLGWQHVDEVLQMLL